jgi:V/A-type H+-transporting ATPase subunit F
MYKIGIIGEKESLMGFGALGADVYFTDNAEQAQKILNKLVSENYAIIFIVENIAIEMKTITDKYKDALLPAIITIPGIKGNLGMGMANVRRAMERAIGKDILFNND